MGVDLDVVFEATLTADQAFALPELLNSAPSVVAACRAYYEQMKPGRPGLELHAWHWDEHWPPVTAPSAIIETWAVPHWGDVVLTGTPGLLHIDRVQIRMSSLMNLAGFAADIEGCQAPIRRVCCAIARALGTERVLYLPDSGDWPPELGPLDDMRFDDALARLSAWGPPVSAIGALQYGRAMTSNYHYADGALRRADGTPVPEDEISPGRGTHLSGGIAYYMDGTLVPAEELARPHLRGGFGYYVDDFRDLDEAAPTSQAHDPGQRRPTGATPPRAIVQVPASHEIDRATPRAIPTPWTPYAMVYSPDGSRLAIGGGSYEGRGGILLVAHASGQSRLTPCSDLPRLGAGTVSGLCFSADGRHLVASIWPGRQHGGRVAVFAIDGLELRLENVMDIDYSDGSRFFALATGVTLHDGLALVRNHRGVVDDLILPLPLPGSVHRGPVQQFGSQRLVVVGDLVITGNHGEPEVSSEPDSPYIRQYAEGRLVIASLTNLASPQVVDVEGSSSISAIARVGDRIISGGRRGELDAWSLDGRWQRQRVREATRREPPSTADLDITSTYLPDSIVDICAIPHGGAASASVRGELCLFEPGTSFVSRTIPAPGRPRSLAAHPDGGALAVGIKQSGPASVVAILDLGTPIEPAWRTPRVRALARAAAGGDANAFAVLADALEDAGGAPELLRHLRHHDPALASCWVIDALVAR